MKMSAGMKERGVKTDGNYPSLSLNEMKIMNEFSFLFPHYVFFFFSFASCST
jgi:hypothetical protein